MAYLILTEYKLEFFRMGRLSLMGHMFINGIIFDGCTRGCVKHVVV